MKRVRLQCEHLRKFGGVENPCHKILCEVVAEEVAVEGTEYIVTDLKEMRIKCFHPDCRRITVIKTKQKEN